MTSDAALEWARLVLAAQHAPDGSLCVEEVGSVSCAAVLAVEGQRQRADVALRLLAQAIVSGEIPAEVWDLATCLVQSR